MYFLLSCIFILVLLYVGLNQYIKLAKKLNIFSLEENGSLHSGKKVRGGGLIFGIVFCIFVLILPEKMTINVFYQKPFLLCALSCLALGFVDDVFNIKIIYKFFVQFLISSILVYYLYKKFNFILPVNFNFYIDIILLSLLIVWFLNAFNFMDGSDGHLSTLIILQNCALMTILFISELDNIFNILIFLNLILVIFLFFNWHPAKLFMGDSGSLFLGITAINIFLYSLLILDFSFILLLTIYSYFFIETSGTLLFRTILGKKWRFRHRSHPYQNFSRIYGHIFTLKVLIIYYLVWIFPFSIIIYFFPELDIYLLLLAIIPSIYFLIKFGPFFSSN